MRKILTLSLILSAAAVAGCSTGSKDEFAVARAAPLIVPPDFSLAPPVTGTNGLAAGDAQQQAIDALFGGPAPRSPGETSLLNDAGRNSAEMGIRSTVWDPDTRVVDKGAVTLQILSAHPANSNVASATAGQ
jgi:hypothetical protein